MQIDAMFLTIAGFIGTLILNAFAVGVAYGRLSAKINKNSDDIVNIQARDIVDIRTELSKIDGKFFTPEGEPRLVSFKAHDHICLRANEAITAELRHVTAALNTNTQRVKECGDQVAQLTTWVTVLEEKVEK